VALLSKSVVERSLAAGTLVGFSLHRALQRRCRSVLLKSGRQHDPLVRNLLECVFQVVAPGKSPEAVTA
jgi:hypothetical protein